MDEKPLKLKLPKLSRFEQRSLDDVQAHQDWDKLPDRAKNAWRDSTLDSNGNHPTYSMVSLDHQEAIDQKYGGCFSGLPHVPYLHGEDIVDFSGSGEPEDPDATPEILVLVVSRYNNGGRYHVGMVTSDSRYRQMVFEFERRAMQKLTIRGESVLSTVFAKYRLTNRTQAVFEKHVSKECPLLIYLNLAKRYVGFNVRYRTLSSMASRILSINRSLYPSAFAYRAKGIGSHKYKLKIKIIPNTVQWVMEKIWTGLVASGICPWITPEVDEKLSRMSVKHRRMAMRPYVMAYYMALSARKAAANLKTDARKAAWAAKRAARAAQNLATQEEIGENSRDEA